MMETRLIPKKFLKLIKNLADENRNYKKIFGNVFWLEVVKKKNYNWFNLRLNSNTVPENSLFTRGASCHDILWITDFPEGIRFGS